MAQRQTQTRRWPRPLPSPDWMVNACCANFVRASLARSFLNYTGSSSVIIGRACCPPVSNMKMMVNGTGRAIGKRSLEAKCILQTTSIRL